MARVHDASGEFLTITEASRELTIPRWQLTRLIQKAGIETHPWSVDDRAKWLRRADVERLRTLLSGPGAELAEAAQRG